jgi:hypothetical protein
MLEILGRIIEEIRDESYGSAWNISVRSCGVQLFSRNVSGDLVPRLEEIVRRNYGDLCTLVVEQNYSLLTIIKGDEAIYVSTVDRKGN